MFIELIEIEKTKEVVGPFMINTNNISFIDTVVLDDNSTVKRVRTNDQVTFFISDKDYGKLKKLLSENNLGPTSM
jgi:hypothetical protein